MLLNTYCFISCFLLLVMVKLEEIYNYAFTLIYIISFNNFFFISSGFNLSYGVTCWLSLFCAV
jgi:hypothetical protein